MCRQYSYSYASALFHVENADKDLQTIEVEEPKAEYQKQPEAEYQEQEPEPESYQTAYQAYDYTNFESQQGKELSILILKNLFWWMNVW